MKIENFIHKLDLLYLSKIGFDSEVFDKNLLPLCVEFRGLLSEGLFLKLHYFFDKELELISLIQSKRKTGSIYNQSSVIFILWLIKNKKHSLVEKWPLNYEILANLATDFGHSLDIK